MVCFTSSVPERLTLQSIDRNRVPENSHNGLFKTKEFCESPSCGTIDSDARIPSHREQLSSGLQDDSRGHSRPKRSRSKVRFASLTVREYEVTPGDNPSCSKGPPVSLGWAYNESGSLSIDCYEAHVQESRRTREQIKLPWFYREMMLQEFGYSDHEIQHSVWEKERIRQQRMQTLTEQGVRFVAPKRSASCSPRRSKMSLTR